MPGDITVFYTSPVNDNHMMCGSWDMKPDRQNFFCRFGPFFALLAPSNKTKNYCFKKMRKTPWDIIIVHNCNKKSWSSAILFLTHGTWRMGLLFFILDYFLPFYSSSLHRPLQQLEKSKFQKHFQKKNTWRYYLTHAYQKLWLDDVWFLRYS